LISFTETPTVYGDGGAGSKWYSSSPNVGGSGNGGTTVGAGLGTYGTNGVPNTGSGGGGAYGDNANVFGGHGGSGIVGVRWLTVSKPVFTQPISDTTTAGLVETFTVSATPTSGMNRSFQWQSSSDTGTTWSNISTGTGFTTNTYVTPILETTISGSRYQYRVIVTDTDTAGSRISDTSTAVFLIINPRIAISGSATSQKYGTTHTDTFTATAGTGTGNKTFTYTTNTASGLTWNLAATNQIGLTVARTLKPGTYYETITATDTVNAKTSLGLSIVVTKADTVTITVAAISETYSGSILPTAPSFTISGLVNTDTVTASQVTWSYSGTENSGATYGASATKPINAGSYTITPSLLVSLSDSYTATTIVTAPLTINRASRTITETISATSVKYGGTLTLTSSVSAGTGLGTTTYSTLNSESCTVVASTITAIKSSGTCSFTATISQSSNFEAATSAAKTATLQKADTITVTAATPRIFTYTGAQVALTETATVTGLVLTDTTTSTSMTFSYGLYKVGDTSTVYSSTLPTDAGTYQIVPSNLTLTSGSLSNYTAVNYVSAFLTINKAKQAALYLAPYGALFGYPYRLIIGGGSGTGALSYSVTLGTASSCSISGDTVTAGSVGTCIVTVTKATDTNYETASVTSAIYFLIYVIDQPSGQTGSGPTIALNGATSLIIDNPATNQAPSITGLSRSTASVGQTIVITGTGFVSGAATSVEFWRGVPAVFTVDSSTQITATVPADATTGKILVITTYGMGVSPTAVTIG
jgi:hypothetical protein